MAAFQAEVLLSPLLDVSALPPPVRRSWFPLYRWRVRDNEEKKEITICSSAAEYLALVVAAGKSQSSVEMRYEDELPNSKE